MCTNFYARGIFAVVCLLALLNATMPVQAQGNDDLRVLILNSYGEGTLPYVRVRTAFMTELRQYRPSKVIFRQFDLQERWRDAAVDHELKAELLRLQYGAKPPGLVVAVGDPAVSFWLDQREATFPAAAVVALAIEPEFENAAFRPGDAVVTVHFSFRDVVADILAVQPDTDRVFVVFGASEHERALAAQAAIDLHSMASQNLSIEFANGLGMYEVQARAAALGPDAAVLYGMFDGDPNGVVTGGQAGLKLLRSATSVPVFGLFDYQLGEGIVGGRLIRLEALGHEMALSAVRILDEQPAEVEWTAVDLGEPVYDWRELQAWDIFQLPPGSAVRFEPPSLWQKYHGWIVLAITAFIAQSVLVAFLFLQRRQLHGVERARDRLNSKLMSAYEDESRRIARELHDDLSQRLARLSIDAGLVKSNPTGDMAGELLGEMHQELVRVSKDVHDMSYRLHPSLLYDLGLVAALRAECDRIRRQTDATLVETYGQLGEALAEASELCIYRVALESMHNAVRHARADTIELILKREGPQLVLTVRDNGVGFDLFKAYEGRTLGLSSMRERVRLAGGTLDIRSRPTRGGTTVVAAIPAERN